MDDGDVCVDTLGNLYILEIDGIDDNFDDFVDDDPNIKREDIPEIETEYLDTKFWDDIMSYFDYDEYDEDDIDYDDD